MDDYDYDMKIINSIRNGNNQYTRIHAIAGGSKEKFNNHLEKLVNTRQVNKSESTNNRPLYSLNYDVLGIDQAMINLFDRQKHIVEKEYPKLKDDKLLESGIKTVVFCLVMKARFDYATYTSTKNTTTWVSKYSKECTSIIEKIHAIIKTREPKLFSLFKHTVDSELGKLE